MHCPVVKRGMTADGVPGKRDAEETDLTSADPADRVVPVDRDVVGFPGRSSGARLSIRSQVGSSAMCSLPGGSRGVVAKRN